VRCRSRDYQYSTCRQPQRIVSARVVDRHSDRACVEGRSFGWRGSTLWVNHGCDADFEVEFWNSRPPGPGPGPGPGPWPPGDGGGWNDQVPDWAFGDWRSSNRIDGRTQYLSISRNGAATWRGNWTIQGRWVRDGVRFTDGTFVRVDREGRNRLRVNHPTLGRIEFRNR